MPECTHQRSHPTKRTKCNGVIVVAIQCLNCGRSLGEKPKALYNLTQLPEFNSALADLYWAQQIPERHSLTEAKNAAWWTAYNDYLHSDHWRRVREIVLTRDLLCQVCFKARSVQAHHISYESFKRWGLSFSIECVGVCVACHERIHGIT